MALKYVSESMNDENVFEILVDLLRCLSRNLSNWFPCLLEFFRDARYCPPVRLRFKAFPCRWNTVECRVNC